MSLPGESIVLLHSENSEDCFNQSSGEIYLFDKDMNVCDQITSYLAEAGFKCQSFLEFDLLVEKSSASLPSLLLVSIESISQMQLSTLYLLQQANSCQVPIVFTAEKYDIHKHLQAVSSGGKGFIVKPFDQKSLQNIIDGFLVMDKYLPYRVLIVDDDLATASYFSSVLSRVGFSIEILNDPLAILSALANFQPDLVLLDLYMPQCSGKDLATIIRQHKQFTSIPIVFLSVEENESNQFDSLQQGADDFLVKSIKPQHLISTVSARIRQARSLKNLIETDSLTGLLNHAAFHNRLEAEMSRAQRHKVDLSVVMLDLDNFKMINDNHGHAMGDNVLKHLSRLLKSRLRVSDIIGRYGGEEFAIILPDTTPDIAQKIFNKILNDFRNLKNKFQIRSIVSFSAGITHYPEYEDSSSILKAADSAMYAAKNSGKNKIMLDPVL